MQILFQVLCLLGMVSGAIGGVYGIHHLARNREVQLSANLPESLRKTLNSLPY